MSGSTTKELTNVLFLFLRRLAVLGLERFAAGQTCLDLVQDLVDVRPLLLRVIANCC